MILHTALRWPAEHESDLKHTTHTTYLALTGELLGVCIVCQYPGCWCPAFMCPQVITSHGIYCVGQTSCCHPGRKITSTCITPVSIIMEHANIHYTFAYKFSISRYTKWCNEQTKPSIDASITLNIKDVFNDSMVETVLFFRNNHSLWFVIKDQM